MGLYQWRQRDASIHIHPGVATGALITCFNLPTADWASICHSKSVIAPGTAAEGSPSNPLQPLDRWFAEEQAAHDASRKEEREGVCLYAFSLWPLSHYFLIARLALSHWPSTHWLRATGHIRRRSANRISTVAPFEFLLRYFHPVLLLLDIYIYTSSRLLHKGWVRFYGR